MRRTGRKARRPVGPMTGSTSQSRLLQTTAGPSQPQLPQAIADPSQPQLPQATAGPSQPQLSQATVGPSQPQASSDSMSSNRKTRGYTRCLEVWQMSEGKRIRISTNTIKQPVGDKVNKLTSFLGTIARNGQYAPLTFSDWRAVPVEKKDDMWGLVTSKFEFDKNAKSWVMMSIGKKWREWKCELKKLHYLPYETDEERLADVDKRVLADQWKALVEFWNSEEGKTRNRTNTENRKKQLFCHTAGSKSFARIREEERKKRPSGEDPTRADMFILTHTCKNGRPMDGASSLIIEQLNERISEQPELSQNSTARNDVLSQVLGEDRHGRVRTYGLGPSPSDLWGTTNRPIESQRNASATQMRDERYEGLQDELSSLKEILTERDAEMSSLKETMAERDAEMSSLKETMAERYAEMSSLKETMATLMSAMMNPNINLAMVLGASANPNLNQPSSSSSHLVPTPQTHSMNKEKSTTCTSAKNVIEVLLKSIVSPGVTVAKGAIFSKDPLTKVGGLELGTGFWEVSIQVAMVRKEPLIRPHGRYKTIGDAIGSTIAWPISLCMVESRDG